jgi:hypothetical protein
VSRSPHTDILAHSRGVQRALSSEPTRLTATLRIPAILSALDVAQDEGRCGLALRFAPQLLRHGPAPLHDFLDLRAPLSLESARGVAQLTRLLRAVRLAASGPATRWLGDPAAARRDLARALGRRVVLTAAPRSCVRFTAWTDDGVHALDFVSDVIADAGGFSVRRLRPLPPSYFPRESVLRHETRALQWLEVVNVEPR